MIPFLYRRVFRHYRSVFRDLRRAEFCRLYETLCVDIAGELFVSALDGRWITWRTSPRAGHVRVLGKWDTFRSAVQSIGAVNRRVLRVRVYERISHD